MDDFSHANERSSVEYFLFALGFIGFLISTGGVVIASVSAAVAGAILLLLVVLAFYSRSAFDG